MGPLNNAQRAERSSFSDDVFHPLKLPTITLGHSHEEIEDPIRKLLANSVDESNLAKLTRLSKILAVLARVRFKRPKRSEYIDDYLGFRKLSRPFLFRGRMNTNPVLAVGGLGTTGQASWNELEEIINNKGKGPTVLVTSLKGHNGTWTGMVNSRWQDWVQDIVKKAELLYAMTKKPVILHALSTGGLAGLMAMALRPNLFAGAVLIGVPFQIRSKLHRLALNLMVSHFSKTREKVKRNIERKYPQLTEEEQAVRLEKVVSLLMKRWRDMSVDVVSHYEKKSPVEDDAPNYTRLPVRTLIELHRLIKAVEKIKVQERVNHPLLMFHGREDLLADIQAAQEFAKESTSVDIEFVPVDNGIHNLLRGANKQGIFNKIVNWHRKLTANKTIED